MPSKKVTTSKKLSSAKTRVVRGKTEHSRVVSTPGFSLSKSYTSLLYGVLTVLLFFGILFIGYKLINPKSETGSITPEAAETVSPEAAQGNSFLYTVQAGDTLWSISEKMYKTGFKWADIAEANKLTDPGMLAAGTKLSIPGQESAEIAQNPNVTVTPAIVPTNTIEQVPAQTGTGNTISGATYTVQAGDDLWGIAVRAYKDGYKWVDIARANQLSNPDVIHSGNALKLPR